jgi:hypothetical protein
MEQGTPKQADGLLVDAQDAPERADEKRGPGRPKGSKNKTVSNESPSGAPKHTGPTAGLSATELGTVQLALDELRASVDVGFEDLRERIEKIEETVRVLGVSFGKRGGESGTTELIAELKRLAATEQQKGDQVDQWTRVMVELSGADRRRYWRLMRAVYRFARKDAHVARRARATRLKWWHLVLLVVCCVAIVLGAMLLPIV